MNTNIKWVAELEHVREVSLLGTADADFWRARLRSENLFLDARDDRARILLAAADSSFKGFRFRELSISLLVSPLEGNGVEESAFLIRAYNTRRAFAFVERVFFSAPYEHGDILVSVTPPISFQLAIRGQRVFAAEMGLDAAGSERAPVSSGQDGFEGSIYLPGRGRGSSANSQGKFFHARLMGHTRKFQFLPAEDSLEIRPSIDSDVLQALLDSDFTAGEWIVREDASHAKSKTSARTGFSSQSKSHSS